MKKLLSFLSLVLFLVLASHILSADFDNNWFVKVLRKLISISAVGLAYLGFYKFYGYIFKD